MDNGIYFEIFNRKLIVNANGNLWRIYNCNANTCTKFMTKFLFSIFDSRYSVFSILCCCLVLYHFVLFCVVLFSFIISVFAYCISHIHSVRKIVKAIIQFYASNKTRWNAKKRVNVKKRRPSSIKSQCYRICWEMLFTKVVPLAMAVGITKTISVIGSFYLIFYLHCHCF